MATRSTITVRTGENERKEIYCHWDGHPESNGVILLEHYNTQEKAEKLIELGSLSSLGKYLEPNDETHTFDNPEEGVCVAYGRDRGEINTEAIIKRNSEKTDDEQYNYFFDNGVWFVNGKLLETVLKTSI